MNIDLNQINQWILDHEMLLTLLALWALPWKGVALWKAAHRQENKWFIALLIINTFALLEIFYIFYWTKRKKSNSHSLRVFEALPRFIMRGLHPDGGRISYKY